MKRVYFLCCLMLFCSSPLFAYEPDQHKLLSSLSIKLFNQCLSDEMYSLVIDDQVALDISEADAGEDTYLSKAAKRVFNWHFYNPHLESRQQYGPINRSMSKMLSDIESDIRAADHFIARLAGSALHFIEDVTVPAHVMPVFHGPLPPLFLLGATGMYGPRIIHDTVDDWPVAYQHFLIEIDQLSERDSLCLRLFSNEPQLLFNNLPKKGDIAVKRNPVLFFVKNTALLTLHALDQNTPGCTLQWRFFWDYDYHHDYFTGYRNEWDDRVNIGFGDSGTLVGECKMTQEKYENFVKARHWQAVVSGAAFLAAYKMAYSPDYGRY